MVARSLQVDVDSISAPFWTLLIGLKIKREHRHNDLMSYLEAVESLTNIR